jgi:carboxymethylenebutenolidase
MSMLLVAWLAVTPASVPAVSAALPPAEETARAVLDKTPRHAEYVDVSYAGGAALKTFVVYPERKDKAPVVIVLHEIFVLSDWIRSVADRLAADGFIAVAPDMISGKGPKGGGSESVANPDELRALIRGLSEDEVNARVDAVRAWALRLPAASDMTATLGFCWGGLHSFAYAIHRPELDAAVVFYGTNPAPERLRKLKIPVLGLYGGDDARVNTTIDPAAAEAKKRGKAYEYEIYEGAGHGFLRQQSGREGANQRATEKAWPRVIQFLKRHLD